MSANRWLIFAPGQRPAPQALPRGRWPDLGGQLSSFIIKWSRLGMWELLLSLAQERGVMLEMSFLGVTSICAHQKAAGATKKVHVRRNGVLVRRLTALVVAVAPKPV